MGLKKLKDLFYSYFLMNKLSEHEITDKRNSNKVRVLCFKTQDYKAYM